MGKNIHVTNHSQGGYQVKSSGSSKAYRRTETQREAIEIGRELARNQHSELVIHGRDGKSVRRTPMAMTPSHLRDN